MKIILNLIRVTFTAMFIINQAQAQTTTIQIPGAVAYSAVATDVNGVPVQNQSISIRASILSGSPTGTTDWIERHQPTTDQDGYFQVLIGKGMNTGGTYTNFGDINWQGEHYLRIEMDISGGNNFVWMETEQFASVPYALHSLVADSLTGISTDSLMRALGEELLQGINKDSLLSAILIPGTCTCDLQGAYDNGKIININNTIVQNGIEINNTSTFNGTSFKVTSDGNNNGNPGFFQILNANNNKPALGAESNGIGNAFTVTSTVSALPSVFGVHSGIGSVIDAQSTNLSNSTSTIAALTKGTGYAGFFTIRNTNNTNTRAALRSEIPQGFNTKTAGAGQFYIAEETNTAPIIDAQTDGKGDGLLIHLTSPSNKGTGIELIQKGTDSPTAFYCETESNPLNGGSSAAKFISNGPDNPAAAVGISKSGPGSALLVSKANYNTSSVAPAIDCYNQSIGVGLRVTQALNQSNNTSPAIMAFGSPHGPTATFIGGGVGAPNTVNISNGGAGRNLFLTNTFSSQTNNIFEINSEGTGTLMRAFTQKILGINKYVAHFTTDNIASAHKTLVIESNGTGAPIYALSTGTGSGSVFSSTGNSPYDYALQAYNSGTGNGISGYSSTKTGVRAWAAGASGTALWAVTTSGNWQNSLAGYFYGRVKVVGDLNVYGNKNAVIKNASGNEVTVYCEESSEVWFTDYGTGQLNNGTATINIATDFLQTVNTSITYHVYVQAEGDCKGLFVVNKTNSSFTVTESQQGNSNVAFSYRLVAKRKYYESSRLSSPTQNAQVTSTYMQSQWPEVVTDINSKFGEVSQKVNEVASPNYVITSPTPEIVPVFPASDPSSLFQSSPARNPNRLQPSNQTFQDPNTLIHPSN